MQAQLLPIVSLLLSTFFMMAGAGLAGILLPVRAALEGWSTYEIGLLGTGYALAFTIGCLIAPRVVRRAGHVRTFSSLAALLAISALLHGIIVHPLAWILIRGLAGFALAGGYMVIESWLNERVTNETRGTVFSIYMVVTMGAMMTGQYIMPLSDPALSIPFMICAIFFAAAVIPNALSKQAHPQPLTQVKLDLPAIFRNSPAAVVGVFMGGVMAGAWSNMAPVFGASIGFSTTQIATLLVATMAGGIVFQYPLGRLSDRTDRRFVMAGAGIFGLIVAVTAVALAGSGAAVVLAIAFCLGGVIYPAYSLAVAHANDYADSSDFVKISGGLLIVYGFGTMAGPLLAAWLMDVRGPEGIFLATGGAHALYAAYAIWRSYQRPAVPVDEREDFRASPLARTQTPETIAFDPRAEHADPEGFELPWGERAPQP